MKRQKPATFPSPKFKNKHTNDKNYRKVKDHCHYTGKYKGILCAWNIVYVIENIVYLKKFLWLFAMDRTTIIILS